MGHFGNPHPRGSNAFLRCQWVVPSVYGVKPFGVVCINNSSGIPSHQKRLHVLQSELESDEDAQAGINNIINLQSVCEIRWSSRANTLCTLKSAFTAVVTALGYLEEDGDDKSRR